MTHAHICTHILAIQMQSHSEEELQYDYVTTRGIALPTSKALRPPSTDEEEGQYESVIDDPLPPTVQQGYMKVDISSLQPQSIYDDMVQPQSIYDDNIIVQPKSICDDIAQPKSIYDDIVLPE